MTLGKVRYPVQLLRDSKGIYGIGIVGDPVEEGLGQPPELVLRPDRLLESKTRLAALQMLFGGVPHRMVRRLTEDRLRQAIHCEMLVRKGLVDYPDCPRWWSKDFGAAGTQSARLPRPPAAVPVCGQ